MKISKQYMCNNGPITNPILFKLNCHKNRPWHKNSKYLHFVLLLLIKRQYYSYPLYSFFGLVLQIITTFNSEPLNPLWHSDRILVSPFLTNQEKIYLLFCGRGRLPNEVDLSRLATSTEFGTVNPWYRIQQVLQQIGNWQISGVTCVVVLQPTWNRQQLNVTQRVKSSIYFHSRHSGLIMINRSELENHN